ncbi:MAG: Ig-like domain-containing protein [Gemmatimonadales bacterium]
MDTIRRRQPRTPGVAALLALAACTTDTTVGPHDIASLAVFPDTASVVMGGSTLLAAVARDSLGVAYVGAAVRWTSSDEAVATVTPGGRVTGVAAGTATIQATSGPHVATAQVAVIGPPAQIAVSAGDNQTTEVNTPVGVDPAVLVTDVNGRPVPGVAVTFAVATGAGSVADSARTTGANGIATVTAWSVGPVAGIDNNTLTATAAHAGVAGNPITFTASATPGSASQLAVATEPAGATSNVAFTTPPVVRVQDSLGNTVSQSGLVVTAAVFSGTGTLAGTTTATTVNGVATFTDLGVAGRLTGYGDHRLQFTAPAVTPATSAPFSVLVSAAYNVQFIYDSTNCRNCHAFTRANTVNVASACAATPILVVPNNTNASHMYRKLAGTQACSSVMPFSGSNATFVDILGRWINQGAPSN